MIDTSDTNPKPAAPKATASKPTAPMPTAQMPTASSAPLNPARTIRDVADFHLRWNEFRPIAQALGRNPALNAAEADTLAWMVELLDRIGPHDMEDGGI